LQKNSPNRTKCRKYFNKKTLNSLCPCWSEAEVRRFLADALCGFEKFGLEFLQDYAAHDENQTCHRGQENRFADRDGNYPKRKKWGQVD
jgi:hypothetical protein